MTAGESFGLAPDVAIEEIPSGAPGRTWGDRFAPLVSNKLALIGGILTLFFFGIAIVGGFILAFSGYHDLYLDQNLRNSLVHPLNKGTLLGTDNLGRSIAWRLIAGTAVSLWAGLAVTVLSISVGLVLGSVAGYTGGWIDRIISA